MITLLLLVRATYMHGVVLHAHPVRGESHIQRNTTGEVAIHACRILLLKELAFTSTQILFFYTHLQLQIFQQFFLFNYFSLSLCVWHTIT